jgi:hypothetical protein
MIKEEIIIKGIKIILEVVNESEFEEYYQELTSELKDICDSSCAVHTLEQAEIEYRQFDLWQAGNVDELLDAVVFKEEYRRDYEDFLHGRRKSDFAAYEEQQKALRDHEEWLKQFERD